MKSAHAIALAIVLPPLAAEGLAQLVAGDSHPMPPMFATGEDGRWVLQPGASVQSRSPDGRRSDIQIDRRGLRAPAQDALDWLVVGDSLAFGLGVSGEDTVSVAISERGRPTATAAVPGHSLAQALATADAHAHRVCGFIVLPNTVDDDRQQRGLGGLEREVVGGWLLRPGAPGWVRAFAESSVSHRLQVPAALLQIWSMAAHLNGPASFATLGWVDDPEQGAKDYRKLGESVRHFAENHPDHEVVTAWVPLPGVTVADRPAPSVVESGRLPLNDEAIFQAFQQGLGALPLVDARPRLVEAAHFIDHDTHLSRRGHHHLADLLVPRLPECR